MTPSRALRTICVPVLLLGLSLVLGCRKDPAPGDFVARVGSAYLSRPQLDQTLASLPPGLDSAEAKKQVVEQWVTRQLLLQEAKERGLDTDPDVVRQIEENARSILMSALIVQLYEEDGEAPTPAEMQAYYENNRAQLRLLEPYVRVRYLAVAAETDASAVRSALQRARPADADSVFAELVARYAVDAAEARAVSKTYRAERRVFEDRPAVRDLLRRLRPGQVGVAAGDSLFHVVQFVGRAAEGTVPEPAWIEDELARRVRIAQRKQLYARQVQRLRTEALAREALEVRE